MDTATATTICGSDIAHPLIDRKGGLYVEDFENGKEKVLVRGVLRKHAGSDMPMQILVSGAGGDRIITCTGKRQFRAFI